MLKGKDLLSIHDLSTDEVAEFIQLDGRDYNYTVGTVLRFIPPLIITNEQVDEVTNILDSVLGE